MIDAEFSGTGCLEAKPLVAAVALDRVDHGLARAPTIIVDDLVHPIIIGVERRADMRKPVPLRGILRPQQHRVVTDDASGCPP